MARKKKRNLRKCWRPWRKSDIVLTREMIEAGHDAHEIAEALERPYDGVRMKILALRREGKLDV